MKTILKRLTWGIATTVLVSACASQRVSPSRQSASSDDVNTMLTVSSSVLPTFWPILSRMEFPKEDLAIARDQGGKYILNSVKAGNEQLPLASNSPLLRLLEAASQFIEEKGTDQDREAWKASTNLQKVITIYRGLNSYTK